jgi:hypothetical protein
MKDDAAVAANQDDSLATTEEQVREDQAQSEHDAPAEEADTTQAASDDADAKPASPVSDSAEGAEEYKPSDVFAWANNLYQYKDQLQIDLFLINKNNVMYRSKVAPELSKQLQPLFITNILDFVLNGAAEGLVVRGFEDAEAEENVLQRTPWENVDKLVEVMHWIRTQEQEIQQFVEEEHDLKRIKAVMARCSHPAMSQPFYVIKQLPRSTMLKGDGAWMMAGKVFMPFEDAVALRIPADNQLLVLEQDLYVFSQPKLRSLFGYDAKKNSIAEKKVAELEQKFKLVFAEGEDLQTMIKGNKQLINKLQKLELTDEIKQDQIIDHGEELGLSLMTDEDGAIIIETPRDLAKFINLVNDDYVESNLTGIRYEIKAKRALKLTPEDE